jgi:hypothetical protein
VEAGEQPARQLLHWRGRHIRHQRLDGRALGTLPVSKTVIAHWNGSAWNQVPSPSPPQSGLADVAATSARNAWAVGSYGSTHPETLILRWNGTSWKTS